MLICLIDEVIEFLILLDKFKLFFFIIFFIIFKLFVFFFIGKYLEVIENFILGFLFVNYFKNFIDVYFFFLVDFVIVIFVFCCIVYFFFFLKCGV